MKESQKDEWRDREMQVHHKYSHFTHSSKNQLFEKEFQLSLQSRHLLLCICESGMILWVWWYLQSYLISDYLSLTWYSLLNKGSSLFPYWLIKQGPCFLIGWESKLSVRFLLPLVDKATSLFYFGILFSYWLACLLPLFLLSIACLLPFFYKEGGEA